MTLLSEISPPGFSGCHLRSAAIEFPVGGKNFHTGVQAPSMLYCLD